MSPRPQSRFSMTNSYEDRLDDMSYGHTKPTKVLGPAPVSDFDTLTRDLKSLWLQKKVTHEEENGLFREAGENGLGVITTEPGKCRQHHKRMTSKPESARWCTRILEEDAQHG